MPIGVSVQSYRQKKFFLIKLVNFYIISIWKKLNEKLLLRKNCERNYLKPLIYIRRC